MFYIYIYPCIHVWRPESRCWVYSLNEFYLINIFQLKMTFYMYVWFRKVCMPHRVCGSWRTRSWNWFPSLLLCDFQGSLTLGSQACQESACTHQTIWQAPLPHFFFFGKWSFSKPGYWAFRLAWLTSEPCHLPVSLYSPMLGHTYASPHPALCMCVWICMQLLMLSHISSPYKRIYL